MASGVQVADDCLVQYKKLKAREFKYIIFAVHADKKNVIVQKTSASTDYEEFLNDLPKDGCCWAVYDLEFVKDGAKRNKICFISWSSDTAGTMQKMLYSSSRLAIRRALDGIGVEIQGTDFTEVSKETVESKAQLLTR